MTLAVMADFGITVERAGDFSSFSVPQGCYQGREYRIEGDASNASYFWAAAAITGGRVTVTNVPVPSLQGDAMLVPLLGRMGCHVEKTGEGITLQGSERLEAIHVDMADMPDVVPTLAVVAAFAHGTTVIENIAHLRIKECDRLSAVVAELSKLGAKVEERESSMIIHGDGGASLHGAEINTYADHRMAMCYGRGRPENPRGKDHRRRMCRKIFSRLLATLRPPGREVKDKNGSFAKPAVRPAFYTA